MYFQIMITEEDPIQQLQILRILSHSGSNRTYLNVVAQVLHCDKWAILSREGQSANHATDVPSLIPRKRIFI